MDVKKAPSYNIVTLGCEKNSVDSEGMGQMLTESGYTDAARPEDADVLIVNTCGFLQARQASRWRRCWNWRRTSGPTSCWWPPGAPRNAMARPSRTRCRAWTAC